MRGQLIKIAMLLWFLLIIGENVSAQERLVLLQSTLMKDEQKSINYYLDVETIKVFANSKFQEAWLKKTFSDKKIDLKNVLGETEQKGLETTLETRKDTIKDKNKNKNKIVYQFIHMQFDPVTSKYKVLEVHSFNEWGQTITAMPKLKKNQRKTKDDDATTKPVDWTNICPSTIEEVASRAIYDYIEKNHDRVQYL